ncbi:leucine-rich repeat receptor-like protein kinase PXC2 [Cornus florida]|uniref:leucine-rich repeat receptor-like protein kinase PXC2 n=1 Tax=Cornus florida TaxID=4283 RepID=UPI00289E8BD3|nr:leucine-rich repeat receptor-like protein kinase PXC2 [Cornus florida]
MVKLSELLRNNLASDFPWNNKTNSNPCLWKGVLCNSTSSSITKVFLSGFSLSTSHFLPVLCQIDTLRSIYLSNNHLSEIPNGFMIGCGEIGGSKLLNFSMNKLSSPLPTFHGFGMLEFLDLSHNFLDGEIHLQLDGLVGLKSLNLSHNQFSGSVPELASCRNLSQVDLSANKLSGSVPETFSQLSELEILNLQGNNLSGRIPDSIGNLNSLLELQVGMNRLIGNITSLPTNLQIGLNLSNHLFEGPIPHTLSQLKD